MLRTPSAFLLVLALTISAIAGNTCQGQLTCQDQSTVMCVISVPPNGNCQVTRYGWEIICTAFDAANQFYDEDREKCYGLVWWPGPDDCEDPTHWWECPELAL